MKDKTRLPYVPTLVRTSVKLLRESEKTMEDVFNILFRHEEYIMVKELVSGKVKETTYGEARKKIDDVATRISSVLGFSGKFVALASENCPEWLWLFWGILKSGNKPYLVNLRQPESMSIQALDTLGVDFVFKTTDNVPSYGGRKVISYGELLKAQPSETVSPFGNEIALTTSGTTLSQKICVYTGTEISEQILNSEEAYFTNKGLGSLDNRHLNMLLFLPLYHIFGLEAAYLWFAFFGITFVFTKSIDPDVMLETIRKCRVTHIFAVPLLWTTIEKQVLGEVSKRDEKTQDKFEKGIKLSLKLQNICPKLGIFAAKKMFREIRDNLFGDTVKFCISGGSYIRPSTIKLINALGYPLHSGYGSTETGITCVNLEKKPSKRIDGTNGKPFGSVDFSVDENGILSISGKTICHKIYECGELLPSDKPYCTGDVVILDKKNNLTVLGRQSDVVIDENGENLNPDLAEIVFELPSAVNFCVLGNEANEKLRLVVQIPENFTEEKAKSLDEEIEEGKKKLTNCYRVHEVRYTRDPLMSNTEIKVSRAALRKKIGAGLITLSETPWGTKRDKIHLTDPDGIHDKIRTAFADALGINEEDISDDDHFLNDLGGTSLDYFSLVATLNDEFNISLPVSDESFRYSVDGFFKIIREKLGK